MRRRRVIIFDTDRDLLCMLLHYFSLRGEYDILTYNEPSFCPVWVNNNDCTNTTPCADIIISGDVVTQGISGGTLFNAQSHNGCEVSIKNKALVGNNFNDNEIKKIMKTGCIIFEKPIDFNKMTVWLSYREKSMDLSTPLMLQRKEERWPTNEIVKLFVQPNSKILRCIALNKSFSGLCLKANSTLENDQSVIIQFNFIQSLRGASVRWTNKMEDGCFMIGLQYVQETRK